MATIGTFKKTAANEYTGDIVTLGVQARGVRIVPDLRASGENAPSHRILVGRADYAESGIMQSVGLLGLIFCGFWRLALCIIAGLEGGRPAVSGALLFGYRDQVILCSLLSPCTRAGWRQPGLWVREVLSLQAKGRRSEEPLQFKAGRAPDKPR